MKCEHRVEWWPTSEESDQKWWQKMFSMTRYVTYHWHCYKCGIEMVPVFEEKKK